MQPSFQLGRELENLILETASALPGFSVDFEPEVRPAEPRFGDFQANGVLPFAKRHKTNPRALGETLRQALAESGRFPAEAVQIDLAGPGFLNFRFSSAFLLDWLRNFRNREDLQRGAADLNRGKTIVVDFSSPNTAKQMHVGHIRTTVIGEAVSRLLAFSGASVIRDNHIGDWGTQFGILIYALKQHATDLATLGAEAVPELEKLYKWGSEQVRQEPSALEAARRELVKLQQGDPENTALWEAITEASRESFQEIYDLLGIRFDVVLGESFYRDQVDRVCRELQEAGLTVVSEGALVVFHPEHPRFREQPMILRKSDGASNYATTDMATALYRVEHFKADAFIIITDARQKDHFEQIFLTFEKWMRHSGRPVPDMHHLTFGTVLDESGKAIKTRSGEPVLLKNLFHEGIERARRVVQEKNPGLDEAEREHIARVVGIEAIRYADLCQNRTSDYKFQWDKLLSFDGNTAPYLLYAIARIYSIFKRIGLEPGQGEEPASAFETEAELALARKLIGFPQALQLALQDLRPHYLCSYLYELAGEFSSFYNADKVMLDDAAVRARRLILCARTLNMLETGCHLLGMQTLKRM